jgi:hypothetical protein
MSFFAFNALAPGASKTTRLSGRPVILAAAGLLGDLLGREELVGRQRALDRQQPLQVLGQRARQLERAPAAALVRDGQLDSGAPDVSDLNGSDCRRRTRILASTRLLMGRPNVHPRSHRPASPATSRLRPVERSPLGRSPVPREPDSGGSKEGSRGVLYRGPKRDPGSTY